FDDIRDQPKAGFDTARNSLEKAGAQIIDAEIPEVSEALALSGILFATEAYAQWQAEIEANPEAMFPEILNRFRSGKDTLARDFLAAWAKLESIQKVWAEKTAGFDAVILPTSPILPPNLERLMTDSEYYVTENLLALRNTRIGNLMGVAGLTLPTGIPSAGIMFLSAPHSEERLLRLGAAAEAALG
ncbi:MAG: amidase family protein, partial [Pseudomonadota bacterium]